MSAEVHAAAALAERKQQNIQAAMTLLAAAHAFPKSVTGGWAHEEERLAVYPPTSIAASFAAYRINRATCSPEEKVSFAAAAPLHAYNYTPGGPNDAALVETPLSAVCDANGRGDDGRAAGQHVTELRLSPFPASSLYQMIRMLSTH